MAIERTAVASPMSDLLTARELADLLRYKSVQTVLRYAHRGEIPFIQLPDGSLRFRESAVEAWLDRRSKGVGSRLSVIRGQE